jgi:hypothetical protein
VCVLWAGSRDPDAARRLVSDESRTCRTSHPSCDSSTRFLHKGAVDLMNGAKV